jgi:hypothetical protein
MEEVAWEPSNKIMLFLSLSLSLSLFDFVLKGWIKLIIVNSDYSLNSVNQLMFVMVKCCVLFEVRAEFLNIIYISFGLKGWIKLIIVNSDYFLKQH